MRARHLLVLSSDRSLIDNMASSSGAKGHDTTSCGYCLESEEKMVNKKTLPCGHLFCLPCLRADLDVKGKLICVTCRLIHCIGYWLANICIVYDLT